MKRTMAIVLTIIFCFSLISCGKNSRIQECALVTVSVINKVPNRIKVLSAGWSIDGNTVGTTGVEVAGGGDYLGENSFSFFIDSDEIADEKDLQKLVITVNVSEAEGESFRVGSVKIPSSPGDNYTFELHCEDGCYSLWQSEEMVATVMKGKITDIENQTMFVTPLEGSWELNSSDRFAISMEKLDEDTKPEIGDSIEIIYDGSIEETYPASLGGVCSIKIIR